MEFKLNNNIIGFFKDIYGVDVSGETIYFTDEADEDDNELTIIAGSYDRKTDKITIREGLGKYTTETALVHELNHAMQFRHNKSMTLDEHIYIGDDGFVFIGIPDIAQDDRWDDLEGENNGYYDYKIEIDSRIAEVCYQYYTYDDLEVVKELLVYVFKGGCTKNLRYLIEDMNDRFSEVKELFLQEWDRRKAIELKDEEDSKKSLDELIDDLLKELDIA